MLADRIMELAHQDDRPEMERNRLVRLMSVLAVLPPPPDPVGLMPRYGELHDRFIEACSGRRWETLEEAFLELYCHLHGHDAPYSTEERRAVDETGGYWCHAGGLSPVLKAVDHLGERTVSGDFGAGNGLQCLLMQLLRPHALTVQIEISSRMVEAGRALQRWLGIGPERVEWRVQDVVESSPSGMDFIYMYRPVHPDGPGRRFYESFATQLASTGSPVVLFSVADCLREFLLPCFEVFHSDGHLTCFRRV